MIAATCQFKMSECAAQLLNPQARADAAGATVNREPATLFAGRAGKKAGARGICQRASGPRMFVSLRHHFGDRYVHAPSQVLKAFRSTALRSGAFAPDGLCRCRFSKAEASRRGRTPRYKKSIEAPCALVKQKFSGSERGGFLNADWKDESRAVFNPEFALITIR